MTKLTMVQVMPTGVDRAWTSRTSDPSPSPSSGLKSIAGQSQSMPSLSTGVRNVNRSRRSRSLRVSAVGSDGEGSGGQQGGSGRGDDAASSLTAEFGMDWRTFRAKLVAQREALKNVSSPSPEQVAGLEIWQDRMSMENWALLASQNPELAKEVPWVHPTGGPEVGGILIAAPEKQQQGGLDQRYWQAVILLLQHDSRGSQGLILNRPSGYTLRKAMAQVNGVDAALSVFAGNAIYVGGYRSDGKTLHFLHGHNLPGSEELMPGVHLGGLEAAAEGVLANELVPTDFRFFVGRVDWMAGRLEEEVERGLWYTAASARSLILKQWLQLPKPLWREMLELMGGDYAEIAKREYGESP